MKKNSETSEKSDKKWQTSAKKLQLVKKSHKKWQQTSEKTDKKSQTSEKSHKLVKKSHKPV